MRVLSNAPRPLSSSGSRDMGAAGGSEEAAGGACGAAARGEAPVPPPLRAMRGGPDAPLPVCFAAAACMAKYSSKVHY